LFKIIDRIGLTSGGRFGYTLGASATRVSLRYFFNNNTWGGNKLWVKLLIL
jgi:hypothetical protein